MEVKIGVKEKLETFNQNIFRPKKSHSYTHYSITFSLIIILKIVRKKISLNLLWKCKKKTRTRKRILEHS